MAYPADTQPKTELLINGTWTDISTRVRGEHRITINRGRTNEQGRVSAQRCNLTINNRDGLFSTRNPNSIYYGLLPRNTQIRVSAGTPGVADTYAKLFPTDDVIGGSYIETPDTAALDITGDLEIRADVQPHSWRPANFQVFISKWNNAATQKSYIFYLGPDGTLRLSWSTTGATAGRITVASTAVVPPTTGRLSVKATLDVDNGAAGNTVAFYTASSIGGTYTQLGSSVVTAGTTSIFSSSSTLVIGGADDGPGFNPPVQPFGGRVYRAQVYSGIAGSLVANPDFTAQTIGTTSFADSTGKTWTINTGRVTSDRIRFWGETSTLPQQWNTPGTDVYVPVTASGMIRRLTQGASPLRSPMYRNFTQYGPNGYWPLEDASAATSAASAAAGTKAATVTNVAFAADSTLPGSGAALQFRDATSKITGSTRRTTATNFASLVLYIKVDALPASGSPGFASFYVTGGVVARIDVGLSSTTWVLNYYDTNDVLLLNSNVSNATTNPVGQWVGFNILLTLSGGNVQASVRWDVAGADAGGVGPTTLSAGAVGYFSRFTSAVAGDTTFQAMRWAHLFMSTQNLNLSTDAFRQASNAYSGERAITRLRRLASEEGISLEVYGLAADSETMGYQTLSTFMDLAYDCQDADQGILAESRDSLALAYRGRVDMENRHDLTLSERLYHLSQIPLAPEDDTGLVNDVTVSRPGGSSSRATVDTGSLSTQAPPNGVGRYDTSVSVNVLDSRLDNIAQWKAFLGTWDEPRFPSLVIGLHRAPFIASASLSLSAFSVDLGDTITLTGLPVWMPPDDVLLLTQGYTEVLWKLTWDITFNTTPAGPYRLPIVGGDDFVPRADASNTVLNAGVTSTAVSIGLKTPTGRLWVTTAANPAEFPFNIKVAGEIMTVTAITGTTSPQTATVTRSVNGIVKAQVINAPIYIAQASYAAL